MVRGCVSGCSLGLLRPNIARYKKSIFYYFLFRRIRMSEKSGLQKRWEALKEYLNAQGITGIDFDEAREEVKILRSAYVVKGQRLPFIVLLNDTVFTSLQVCLCPEIAEDKIGSLLPYLNERNDRFSMLKYHVDGGKQVILTCSMPASDDHFEPALIAALIEEINTHLNEQYDSLMKEVWA